MRKGNLKYGFNNCGDCELYDLEKDPYEMENRINDPAYADDLVAMVRNLIEWMEATNDRVINRFKFAQRNLPGIDVSPTS